MIYCILWSLHKRQPPRPATLLIVICYPLLGIRAAMATSDGESVDSSSDVGRTPLPGGHQGSTPHGGATALTQGSAPLQESSRASTQGSAGVVVSTDNLVWRKSMAVVKYSPHLTKPSTANSSVVVFIPVRPSNTEQLWGGSKGFADQAPRIGQSKCGLCGRGPPEVQMVMREEDANACMGCDDAVVTCFPRQTWRKMVALAGADDDFRQVILKAAQVCAGKASSPEIPEGVGVEVRMGCTIEQIYWHLTPDEFVEEFGYTPEQLQVPVEEQTEDEFGEQTPGVIISVGSLPAAGLARGRPVRVFHSRCSYLDLKSMPESLHCRPNVMAMSYYPDRPNASLRLSPAGATASTQGCHASIAIIPLCREQTFGEIAGVDDGDQLHMLDMGGSPSTTGSSWSAAGGQQVGWSCQGCVEAGSACARPTIATIAIAWRNQVGTVIQGQLSRHFATGHARDHYGLWTSSTRRHRGLRCSSLWNQKIAFSGARWSMCGQIVKLLDFPEIINQACAQGGLDALLHWVFPADLEPPPADLEPPPVGLSHFGHCFDTGRGR